MFSLLLKDLISDFYLEHYGNQPYPARFTAMVQQLHGDILALVKNNGEYSEQTESSKAVCWHQHFFSILFYAMLTYAFQDCDDGFPNRYRFDGKFFNLRR